MAADPNMKCACGFRRFRESVRTVDETMQQWVLYNAEEYGGFGSTPWGTSLGGGSVSVWGLFELSVPRLHRITACESCGRPRSDTVIGGVAAYGAYVLGTNVFAVVSDVTLLSCLRVRFRHIESGATLDVSPMPYGGVPLAIDPEEEPLAVAEVPPSGGVVAGVLQAPFPSAEELTYGGEYEVRLVDVCGGTSMSLLTITLSLSE